MADVAKRTVHSYTKGFAALKPRVCWGLLVVVLLASRHLTSLVYLVTINHAMKEQHQSLIEPVVGMEFHLRRRHSKWEFSTTHRQVVNPLSVKQPTPVQCHLPLLIFVTGGGNNGKTSVVRSLPAASKIPMESISMDGQLVDFYKSQGMAIDHYDLASVYNSIQEQEQEQKAFATHIANNIRNTSATALVFEGYGLSLSMQKLIHAHMGLHLDSIRVEVLNGKIQYEGTVVVDSVAMRAPLAATFISGDTASKNKEDIYKWASAVTAHNFVVFIQHLYADYLMNLNNVDNAGTTQGSDHNIIQQQHQCYGEIEDCQLPTTADQFQLLNIPIGDLANQTFLDLNCGMGYVVNHISAALAAAQQMQPPPAAQPNEPIKRILCLEPNAHLLNLASCYGRVVMETTSPAVEFIHKNLWTLTDDNDNATLTLSSSSSYFQGGSEIDFMTCVDCSKYYKFNPAAFLDRVAWLMSPKGVLVLQLPRSDFQQYLASLRQQKQLLRVVFAGPGLVGLPEQPDAVIVHLTKDTTRTPVANLSAWFPVPSSRR